MNVGRRREMIEPNHPTLPITRQCALIGISRSAFYGGPRLESAENLALMRVVDQQFMETPWYGSRQMTMLPHDCSWYDEPSLRSSHSTPRWYAAGPAKTIGDAQTRNLRSPPKPWSSVP